MKLVFLGFLVGFTALTFLHSRGLDKACGYDKSCEISSYPSPEVSPSLSPTPSEVIPSVSPIIDTPTPTIETHIDTSASVTAPTAVPDTGHARN